MDCNLKRLGSVTKGCKIVGIKRPTYYYSPKGSRPLDADIAERIEEIAMEYPSYGYRRITAELRRQDLMVNHKKVLRLMRSQNLLCRARKAYKATTNSGHGLKKYPNLIEDLVPYRVDQVWHADITYIRIATSFVYLAALIDGFSRKVIGYGLGRTLSADLTMAALFDAISKRNTEDIIHHSDRGIQYCSADYVEVLKDHGISISMSGKANPYDNAKIESFFRTLKVEEVYMFEYDTYREVVSRIPYFIEEVYNRKRLHSSLSC
ncbi:MAG TPA: IS3 family transposase [Candidatus Wildermuthbacteria bacterium]|nr:IS3 family transposase [Candidatus Wildermuthbacteria bacterium]